MADEPVLEPAEDVGVPIAPSPAEPGAAVSPPPAAEPVEPGVLVKPPPAEPAEPGALVTPPVEAEEPAAAVKPPGVDGDFAGVRFQSVGKVYHYLRGGLDVKVGNWVVVDTPRGKQMGQVATLRSPRNRNDGPFKRIDRLATGRDMAMRHYYETRELEALIACRAEASALQTPAKVVRAEYSFDGQTLTFLFSSDQEERVETGDLRQAMSRLYRARIEMRQISPREAAKIIGGLGACGIDQRCCSRFLTEFSPISIKHAKEQNLSLNPHDITGMCGRLRCCLIYEFEQYAEARRNLPKRNAIVGTPSGQGKVVEVLPMRDAVVVRMGEGEAAKDLEFHREQLVPLEELKRLQDKAASGTCDKHDGGPCTCGNAAADSPAESAPAPAPEPGAPAADGGPGRAGKKRRKKKGLSSAESPPSLRPPAVAPQSPRPGRPDHRPPAMAGDTETPAAGDVAPAGPAQPPAARPAGQQRPLRRPLKPRRPLPSAPQVALEATPDAAPGAVPGAAPEAAPEARPEAAPPPGDAEFHHDTETRTSPE